ncbi:MAG: hypothetical protein COB76_06640, partial [Alphaproteobacteria bacterium]
MTTETPSIIDKVNLDVIKDVDYSGIIDVLTEHGTKILIAVTIFVVGKWILRRIVNALKAGMVRAKVDDTLVGFLGNIVFGIGISFVVIAALAQMGIETTSLAAVIGAAGLALAWRY